MLPPPCLGLGNPQFMQNGPSMASRNGTACTLACLSASPAVLFCPTPCPASLPCHQQSSSSLGTVFPSHPRCLQAEKQSPISPGWRQHIQFILGVMPLWG